MKDTGEPQPNPYESPKSVSQYEALPLNDIGGEKPTFVRYLVLAALCTLAFIFYVDRICISKAVTSIEEDLKISHSQMSLVLAAFTLSYAAFEIPVGWWGDRYGSRGVLTRIVIGWSVFTALTGATLGLFSLMTVRFLFGAAEAGAFPNTARILSRWFPVQSRGFAQGMINAMAMVGASAAPVMTAYLIKNPNVGWRWTFVIFSLPGILWAVVFYWWYRDDPLTHPSVNAAERKLIQAGTRNTKGEGHPAIPWSLVFVHAPIWMLGAIITCTAFNSYLYFSWYSTYLEKGRGVIPIDSGWLASLVLGGGAIGSISGGFIIDFLTRMSGDRRNSRRWWCSSVLVLAAGILVLGVQFQQPSYSAAFTSVSVLLTLSTLASWWGAVTDVSGRHIGALFGLMNSLGAVGAIASQLFVGPFVDNMKGFGFTGRAQWDPIFYVYATVLCLGAVGWLMVDSTRPLPEDEHAA